VIGSGCLRETLRGGAVIQSGALSVNLEWWHERMDIRWTEMALVDLFFLPSIEITQTSQSSLDYQVSISQQILFSSFYYGAYRSLVSLLTPSTHLLPVILPLSHSGRRGSSPCLRTTGVSIDPNNPGCCVYKTSFVRHYSPIFRS